MKKYRVVFERGRYYPEQKILFFWVKMKVHVEGYNIEKNFETYKKAVGYITINHYGDYGNYKFKVVE